MNENGFFIAIQYILEDYLKHNPNVTGEQINDLTNEAVAKFVLENGLEEGFDDEF